MIDKWLSKSKLNRIIENLVKKIFFNKLSANQVTIIALIIGLSSAVSIFLSEILIWKIELIILAMSLMIVSFFFDALDGALARLKGPTTFGGILDIFCDRTVEVFIIISLISTKPLLLLWPGIYALGAIILCITIFLLIGGAFNPEKLDDRKKVIYYHGGIIERTETFIFLAIITIIYVWRFILLWIFAVLVFITALLRLRDAYNIFKKT